MITNIYRLRDPNSDIRYVGKTTRQLSIRLYHHIYSAERGFVYDEGNHCLRWIRVLLKRGLKPSIELIKSVHGNGNSTERRYIAKYRKMGFNLTNLTDGGGGGMTPETAKKVVESRRRNGTDRRTKESILRGIATKRARGTDIIAVKKRLATYRRKKIPFQTLESCLKGWETRRKNMGNRR